MNIIFDSKETLDTRIKTLEKWSMSTEALENIYKSTYFIDNFIQLAIFVLETLPPQKQNLTINRNIILKVLYRIKTKENPNILRLHSCLVATLKDDHIENIALAAKCILALSKRIRLDDHHLNNLLAAFSSLLDDVMNSFRVGNETYITTNLFVFGEIIPFLNLLIRMYKQFGDKFERITGQLHTFAHLFMTNNEYHIIVINNETILIELVNVLFKLVKYFVDFVVTVNKEHTIKASIPEISMFIMNFCPDEAENMKREIFQQICNFCINQREMFHNYIDIILSDSIIFRNYNKSFKLLGINLATEICVFYRDKITKETLIKIATYNSNLIDAEFGLVIFKIEELNIHTSKNIDSVSIENLKIYTNIIVKINDIFASQKFSYYDKHLFYMKNFFELIKIYKNMIYFIDSEGKHNINDIKQIIIGCLRGFKNIIHYFGSLKDMSQSTIHSLKCFSHDEIAKFSSLFKYSLRLFSNKVFLITDNYMLEEMCVIFIYLEEPNFYLILSSNIEELINLTKENSILFVVWKFYLGIRSIASTFVSLLLNNILDDISDKSHEQFYLMAFDLIFKTLITFPKESDNVIAPRIEFLLQSFSTLEANNFFYFKIFKCFFSYLNECDINYPTIYRVISTRLETFIKTVGELFMLYPHEEIFIELLMMIPTNFIFVISHLQIFFDPLLQGLQVKHLKKLSLDFLNLCIENLHHEFINENLGIRMYELMQILLEMTKEEEFADYVLQIIQKFKGDKCLTKYTITNNKKRLTGNIVIKNEDFSYGGDVIIEKSIELLRGKFVKVSYNYFALNMVDLNDFKKTRKLDDTSDFAISTKKKAFEIVSNYIYAVLGWEGYETEGILERVAIHLKDIQELGLPQNVKRNENCTSTVKYSHFSRIKNVSTSKIFKTKQLVYDAIIALFHCTTFSFNEEVYDLLKTIYMQVAVYKIIEQYKLPNFKSKIYFDYYSFIDPLIECFSYEKVLFYAEKILLHIYSMMIALCESKKILRETCFFQTILSKFISFCFFKDVDKRKAAVNGIFFMIKNLDLEADFVAEQRCQIIKALFFYVRNGTEAQITIAKDIVFYILRKTFTMSNHDLKMEQQVDEKEYEDIFKEESLDFKNESIPKLPDVVLNLVVGLKCSFANVRLLSQSALEYLAELRGLDVTELLQPYRDVIYKKIILRTLQQKDTLIVASLLDALTYILSLRPPLFFANEHLEDLAKMVLEKFEINSEQRITGKTTKFAPFYLKFLLAYLSLSKKGIILEKILSLFIKGLFVGKEITEISSKGLKQALMLLNESTREFLIVNFKPTINVFLHEKPEMIVINSIAIILDIINSINKMEIIEKISEIFRIRDDKILFKALEITSLLPSSLPELFLTEIIDITYLLEQRNRLLNIDKNSKILKEICEKNPAILSLYMKRLNDFCIFKILSWLVKNSFMCKNHLKENPIITENLFSILLFDEIQLMFNVSHCFTAIRVYKDLKLRNKDVEKILRFLRKAKLNAEHINILYQIDDNFIFINPKEKFLLEGLTLESYKKLAENHLRILEANKTNEQLMEITNDESTSGINDEHSAFYSALENLIDTNIDNEFKGVILTIFYRERINSEKIIRICSKYTTKNNMLKYKALLYLSVFEPDESYFEMFIHAHFEYKEYTRPGLRLLIKYFGPDKFENVVFKMMKNQIAYKNHLYIIYPLLIDVPELITYNITLEIFDVICRLFGTMISLHQKIGINLLERIYQKYEYLINKANISESDKNIIYGLSISYTLLFSNYCHSKEEIAFTKINQFLMPINFSFLFFVEESLVIPTLACMIDNELNKNIGLEENELKDAKEAEVHILYDLNNLSNTQTENLEYKYQIGLHLNNYIKKCFNDTCIKESFMKFVDIPFLFQQINRFFANQENPKTVYLIFIHLMKIKQNTNKLTIQETALFDMFVHLSNIFVSINLDFAKDIIISYLNATKESNSNNQLLQLLQEIIKSGCFSNTTFIIENILFILEDKNITLAEKLSFIDNFKYTDESNLSFIITYFNQRPDLRLILQKPFLLGLRSRDPLLRNEFYSTFNQNVSKSYFGRLRYLLNFDWSPYGDNWLYAFFRMSHLGLSDIYFETFKLYVYGDDTFYENIYEESEEYCKKLKRYKPNVNINEFIRNHIYPFVSNTAKYKSKNLADLIFDIVFDDMDAINNIFPLFFVEILKKLTIEEFKIIVNEFIAMILKKQNLDDFKSFYEGFSLLCDFYEKSENNTNKLYASDVCTRRVIINTLEMKIKYIKDCFSDLKYIVNHRNSSSLIPLLNVVDDLHKVEIYRILQEKDHYYGLLKAICKYPATLIALNTHLNSDEKKAMELYEELQDKARLNELSFNEDEYEILEREWIECAKTLQQWDILYELGNFSGDCPLITDASFRTCNFLLESERSNVSGIIELRKKTVQRQFYENFIDFMAYERIDAGQMYSNDFIMARTAQDLQMKNKLMLLKKDYLLYLHSYPLCTKQTSETLLFIKMIDEMINPPNNFDLISNYESIQNWDIFVTFRMHLYDLLAKREPSKKYYHEKARALNAISKKCRKEKYYELSMYTLQKIFVLPSIEANDAYKKIAGEIKVLYEGGNYQNAIEIANLCNLNFFNNQKKANIFAWKGRLAEKINDFDDANRNFLHAIQIDSSIGKNWYSWGIYLDRKFEEYINTLESYEDEINNKNAMKNKININSSLNNLDDEKNQNVINDSINNKIFINYSNHDKDLINNSRIDETLMKMDNLGLSNNTIDDKLNKNLSHENSNLTNDNIKNNSEEFFKININENENILININGDVKQGDKNSIKLTENYINQLKAENKDLLLNVFSAFLQSASLNSGSKARKSVLKLLKYFKFKNEGVKTTFEAHKDDIDITKCFFFIPQLISMMNTDYYDCAQIVLMRMIEKYPQSVFLHLRSEMDRSERLNGKKLEEESSQLLYNVFMKRDSQVKSNFSYSRLTNLFGSSSFYLASTFFTLEKIVSDLIIKMRCSAEEDVYRMSDAIFNESINKIFDDSPYSCDDLAVLIERMNCVLEKSRIGSKYKLEFKKDFYKQESLSLVELARIAMKWTSIFKNILKSVPVIINLGIIKTINDYNSFNMGEVQVFGQYNEIRNIYDNFVTIESFEPATITTWRNGTSIKRVIIRGNNGKKYAFAFCDPISNVYRREDRSIQLAEFMHSEMDYNMRFKSYVNLSEKSRLISIHEDYYFYDDILNENLITKGLCVGDLIFKYLGYLHVDFKNLINVNKNEALKCFSDRDLNPERERPVDVSKDSSTSASKIIQIESNENNNDVCDLKRDANNVNSEFIDDEQKDTNINGTYDLQKFKETNAKCSGDEQKDTTNNGTYDIQKFNEKKDTAIIGTENTNKNDVKNSKCNDYNCKDYSKNDNNELSKKNERKIMNGINIERNVPTVNFNDTANNHNNNYVNNNNVSLTKNNNDIHNSKCEYSKDNNKEDLMLYKNIIIKEFDYEFTKKMRYEAFKKLYGEIGNNILVDFFKESLIDSNAYFFYKKCAIDSFSCRSVFLHLFAVSLRTPCRIAIGRDTADCYNLDVFPYLNKEYKYITNEIVPLRLTPNIQKFFGREGIEGSFSRISYGICRDLIESDFYKDLFFLCLGDEEGFGREKKLLQSNFECVNVRIKKMMENLHEVLNDSTNPENLCMMNPLWHPWF